MASRRRHSVVEKVAAAGESQGWLSGGTMLAALSGGGDSMAMFCALRELRGGSVSAAHLEHGFRGEASIADAEFVRSFCASLGAACYARSVDVMAQRGRGESPEMAGRRIRYEFFDEIADREGFTFIATGHTSDDAVETMLYDLFRGTGLRGLAGIAPVRGRIVRPIIGCSRAELRDYLRSIGVEWREDATNDESHHRRNRIRNELLPWVRSNLNSSPERALLGLAAECRELVDASDERADQTLRELASTLPGGALAAWDIRRARALCDADLIAALRAQARALDLRTLDRRRTLQLVDLIRRSGRWRFQWSGDVEAAAASGAIVWLVVKRDA